MIGLGGASGVRKGQVRAALAIGYRFIDTAQAYQWGYHEDEVGAAIHSSGVPREDLFIQTKIHPEDLGYNATRRAFQRSLERLNTTYVDSLLLHKPACWEGACSQKPEGTWQDSWRALEELYDTGTVKAIGMCDVRVDLLDELLKQRIPPHIVQNWFDPFHQDKTVRKACWKAGVQYQGYSLFGTQWKHQGFHHNPIVDIPDLKRLEAKHQIPIHQIVLQWALSRNVVTMPASRRPDKLRQNLESFKKLIPESDRHILDQLDGLLERRVIKGAPELPPKKKVPEALKKHDSQILVEFHSEVDGELNVVYVDESGAEHKVGTVSPDTPGRIGTTHGHHFRFLRASGQSVGDFVADIGNGPQQSHIISAKEL